MKATLEFNLPNDRENFELAVNSSYYYTVIFEMDQYLRSRIKYAEDDESDDTINAFQNARDKLHEFMAENGINLEL